MTHITAGDRRIAANEDVLVSDHLHTDHAPNAVIPRKATARDEDTSEHSFEVCLGRPARLLLDLPPGTCRWPLGDLDDPHFQWCGCPSMGGAPYCATHMRLSRAPYQPKTGEIDIPSLDRQVTHSQRGKIRTAFPSFDWIFPDGSRQSGG